MNKLYIKNSTLFKFIALVIITIVVGCGGGTVGTGITDGRKIKISGVVTDANQKPLAGTVITTENDPQSYETDQDGKFTIETAKGDDDAVSLTFSISSPNTSNPSSSKIDLNAKDKNQIKLKITFDETTGFVAEEETIENELDVAVETPSPTPSAGEDVNANADKECAQTSPYKVVCGQDGKTYYNECEPRIHAIGIEYEGPCLKTADCSYRSDLSLCLSSLICDNSGKVCGKDYKTYASAQEAHNAGVGVLYGRACIKHLTADKVKTCSLRCAQQNNPKEFVCARGVTYNSECEALENNEDTYTPGACKPVENQKVCDLDPLCKYYSICFDKSAVCGFDNITYRNALAAGTAGVAYRGDCIQGARVSDDCNFTCSDQKIPEQGVCAIDGRNFNNHCQGIIAGVYIVSNGQCPVNKFKDDCPVDFICSKTNECDESSLVCGRNGYNYGSKEEAAQSNVGVAYGTSCRNYVDAENCRLVCDRDVQSPVCGFDNVTYPSICAARYEAGVEIRKFESCETSS